MIHADWKAGAFVLHLIGGQFDLKASEQGPKHWRNNTEMGIQIGIQFDLLKT